MAESVYDTNEGKFVVPVFIIIGIAQAIKEAWREAVALWRSALDKDK